MSEELPILYEDTELIVCHKPAGVPVQTAKIGQKDMVSMLNNYLTRAQADHETATGKKDQRRTGQGERPSIYVVHRLDQPVEGVLVFAKTKRAAAELSRQVSDGSMKKIYQAVCCAAGAETDRKRQAVALPGDECADRSEDYVPGRAYCLVDYLVKDGRTNTSSVVEQGSRNAKRAELSFCVIEKRKAAQDPVDVDHAETVSERGGNRTDTICAGNEDVRKDHTKRTGKSYLLMEIALKTGRHHQIRAQMAHAGLPLYGDRKYNDNWQECLIEPDQLLLSGQSSGKIPLALCAISLTFRHPVSKKLMNFETTPRAEIFSLF